MNLEDQITAGRTVETDEEKISTQVITYLLNKAFASGEAPIKINDCRAQQLHGGFIGGVFRLFINGVSSLIPTSATPTPKIPSTLILKLAPTDAFFVETKAHEREVFFLEELAASLSKACRLPKVYLAQTKEKARNDIARFDILQSGYLLIEDLSPDGYKTCSFETGLNLDQAGLAMTTLANFHAQHWCLNTASGLALKQRFVQRQIPLASQDVSWAFKLAENMLPRFFDIFSTRLKRTELNLCAKLLAMPSYYIELLEKLPLCIAHGDLWCNNLLVLPPANIDYPGMPAKSESVPTEMDVGDLEEQRKKQISISNDRPPNGQPHVALVDFQWMNLGNGLIDLAFLLYSSIEPDILRNAHDKLLQSYYNALIHADVGGTIRVDREVYTFERFRSDFIQMRPVALAIMIASFDIFTNAPGTMERIGFLCSQVLPDIAKLLTPEEVSSPIDEQKPSKLQRAGSWSKRQLATREDLGEF